MCKTILSLLNGGIMDNKVGSIGSKRRLTQQQLAELAGTSQQQIQRIETGMVATA